MLLSDAPDLRLVQTSLPTVTTAALPEVVPSPRLSWEDMSVMNFCCAAVREGATGVGVVVGWADVAGAAAVVAGVLGLVTEGALVAAMMMIRTTRRLKPAPSAVRILWRLGQVRCGGRGGG
jgi:hypothetical protein